MKYGKVLLISVLSLTLLWSLLSFVLPVQSISSAMLSTAPWPILQSAILASSENHTTPVQLVINETFVLTPGQTLDRNLFILNGLADLKEGSVVTGDVILMGGTLQAAGIIQGNVTALSGLVDLGGASVVNGDVNNISGRINRAEGSRIEGNFNPNLTNPFPLPALPQIVAPSVKMDINPFWDLLWLFFRSFIWAALAALAGLFLPRHIDQVSRALTTNPGICAGLGILTILVVPLVLLFLTITLICSPLALLGGFLLMITWAFGVIVLGFEAGQRISRSLKQTWALPLSGSLGVFLLTLVSNGIGWLVPCIGWMLPFSLGILGFGAVLVTRFGNEALPESISS